MELKHLFKEIFGLKISEISEAITLFLNQNKKKITFEEFEQQLEHHTTKNLENLLLKFYEKI